MNRSDSKTFSFKLRRQRFVSDNKKASQTLFLNKLLPCLEDKVLALKKINNLGG